MNYIVIDFFFLNMCAGLLLSYIIANMNCLPKDTFESSQ